MSCWNCISEFWTVTASYAALLFIYREPGSTLRVLLEYFRYVRTNGNRVAKIDLEREQNVGTNEFPHLFPARETSMALGQVCSTCGLCFSSFSSRHLNPSELVTRTICQFLKPIVKANVSFCRLYYRLRYALLFV